MKWIRHSGGWSPVSLEALGRLCTGGAAGVDAADGRRGPKKCRRATSLQRLDRELGAGFFGQMSF